MGKWKQPMLRTHQESFRLGLFVMDLAVCGAVFVALTPDFPGPWSSVLALGAISCVAWPLLLIRRNFYTSLRRSQLRTLATGIGEATLYAALVLLAAAFLVGAPVPLWYPVALAGLQGLVLGAARLLAVLTLRSLRWKGRNTRNVVIVGSGPRALAAAARVARRPHWGLRVVRFVDDQERPYAKQLPVDRYDALSRLPELLRTEVVDEVVVAWPRSKFGALDQIVGHCASAGVPVTILSDLFGKTLPAPRISFFGDLPALSFAPVHHDVAKMAMKRALDVSLALVAVVVVAPVLVACMVLIRTTSPGPALFRQERVGLNGRRFELLKLRTMVVDAEERKQQILHLNDMQGPAFKMVGDPRVTRIGALLRRWSLDELPQFVNVLKGDMSLVGPRPPTPDEVVHYEAAQSRRLSMRPGLTCTWQVSGRNTIRDFGEWVRLDLDYIDNWSLRRDFKLLALTLPAVLGRTGAS